MTNDWILDVLTDLRAFASLNAMPRLAEHLDDATLAAAAEIAAAKAAGDETKGIGQAVVIAAASEHVEGPDGTPGGSGLRRNA